MTKKRGEIISLVARPDCPRRAVVLNGRVVVKVDHVVIHSRSLDAQDHQSLLEMTVLALIQGFQGTYKTRNITHLP